MSIRKMLKHHSDIYNKILKAENILDEMGISITYGNASDGVIIKDNETGHKFSTRDFADGPCFNFPREVETRFVLLD